MKPDICIYHAPCADGFTAAWAIWKRWPDIEFIPGVYGAPPPDVTGKDVLIVDFSYKRPVLEEMARTAQGIIVLDHHKSAEEDLGPYAGWPFGSSGVREEVVVRKAAGGLPLAALFDMTKSGAMLAWEYAHPGEPAPRLISYVQDRDLWRFELMLSREFSAFLFSLEYTFDGWDEVARQMEDDEVGFPVMAGQGAAIERKHRKDVAELLKITTREMVIGGERVKVANLPYTMASDAAGLLAEGAAFGACYYDAADGARVFSLRSRAGGADVSKVAVGYGGGGHAAAAGFRAPPGWEGEAVLT